MRHIVFALIAAITGCAAHTHDEDRTSYISDALCEESKVCGMSEDMQKTACEMFYDTCTAEQAKACVDAAHTKCGLLLDVTSASECKGCMGK